MDPRDLLDPGRTPARHPEGDLRAGKIPPFFREIDNGGTAAKYERVKTRT